MLRQMTCLGYLICWCALGPDAHGSPNIDKNQLFEIIAAAEKNCKTIEFEASYNRFDLDLEGRRVLSRKQETLRVKVRLAYPVAGRYYLEAEGRIPIHSPQGDVVDVKPSKFADAYNGQVGTQLWWKAEGPDGWSPRRGYVDRKRAPGNLYVHAQIPFLYFLTQNFAGKGLSSYLTAHGNWSVARQEGEIVDIRVPYPKSELDEIVRLDLSRGANVIAVQQFFGYDMENPELSMDVIVDLEKSGNHWVPKRMRQRRYNYEESVGRMVRTEEYEVDYQSFRYNPPLADEAFVVKMPAGTLVGDRVIGKNFVAAGTGEQREQFLDRAVATLLRAGPRGGSSSQPVQDGKGASTSSPGTREEEGAQQAASSGGSWARWWPMSAAAIVLVTAVTALVLRARRRSRDS